MDMEELPEYIESMNGLKEKFADKIEILCGLEVDYLPSYAAYYRMLAEMLGLDVLIQGVIITALTLAGYLLGAREETGQLFAQSTVGMTSAFMTLSLVEAFHSCNMRTRRKSLLTLRQQNKWLWGAIALSLVLTLAVLLIPGLRTAFGFVALSPVRFLVNLGLAISILPIMELIKLIQRKCGI